jgi:hypothetical protein
MLKRAAEGGRQTEVEELIARIERGEEETAAVESEQKPQKKSANVELQENTLAGEVTILPNPARGLLKIELPAALEADIRIVDMQGSILRETTTRERRIDLNIEDLPAGNYIVHIRSSKGNLSRTIRIEK